MAINEHDLTLVDSFLGKVGKDSLLDYYEITPETATEDIEVALKTRRSWAQAQQANPKHREAALWLIRNNALLRRLLLVEMDAYLEAAGSRTQRQRIEQLGMCVQGRMVRSSLTAAAEGAIHEEARSLGFGRDDVERFLREEMGLQPRSAERIAAESSTASPEDDFVDAYSLLQMDPSASQEELEAAYRARYRWARSLKDIDKASRVYVMLEAAWREISEPARRHEYDLHRQKLLGADHEAEGSETRRSLFEEFTVDDTASLPPPSTAWLSASSSAPSSAPSSGPSPAPMPAAGEARVSTPAEGTLESTVPSPPGTAAHGLEGPSGRIRLPSFEELMARPALPGPETPAPREVAPASPPLSNASFRPSASPPPSPTPAARAVAPPVPPPPPQGLTSVVPRPPETRSLVPDVKLAPTPEAPRPRPSRLRVTSPTQFVFRRWRKETVKDVRLSRDGEASLWVHAQTNQPWVTVEPPSVPSDFTNFTLRLHYLRDPGPGEAWAARLTLIPQWGDRQILAITIERRPAWLGLAIVVCGAIAFLSFLAAYLLGR